MVVLVSCNNNEVIYQKNGAPNNNVIEALFHGKICKIDSMFFTVSYKNSIFLLGQKLSDTSKIIYLKNFKTDNHNLYDVYFTFTDLLGADSLPVILKNTWIMKKSLNGIETEQNNANNLSDSLTQNNQNNLLSYDFESISCQKEQINLQEQLLKGSLVDFYFENALRTGIFFKTSSKYYVLIENDFLYFISETPPPPSTTFMFHLLNKNGKFVNKDFVFDSLDIGPFKEMKFQKLFVAKLPFERSDFVSIRIGEYSRLNGLPDVKWSQTILLEHVFNNELLTYENQFE